MMEFCRYELRGKRRLHARRDDFTLSGWLVRVEGGVACLQSWPELGDPALAEVVEDFRGPRRLPISQRAWECCRLDREARSAGKPLLEGLSVPESHYTLPWGTAEVPPGFRAVKVKAGPDQGALLRVLRDLPPDLRIRLDFNESLPGDRFGELWRSLEPFHARLDWVEDPAPYDFAIWSRWERELGCRLAVDRHEGETPFLRVWKPARRAWQGGGEVLVTSNMDHPVGQVFAAWCAAQLHPESGKDGGDLTPSSGRTGLSLNTPRFAEAEPSHPLADPGLKTPARVVGAGLVTQHLFEGCDPFLARLGPARPDFPRLSGTGLGFDDLLETLAWRSW